MHSLYLAVTCAVFQKIPHWALERHLPYGITQCYLPPSTGLDLDLDLVIWPSSASFHNVQILLRVMSHMADVHEVTETTVELLHWSWSVCLMLQITFILRLRLQHRIRSDVLKSCVRWVRFIFDSSRLCTLCLKNIPDIFDCNLKTNCQILIFLVQIFLTQLAIKWPFSFLPHPNAGFCTTWGKHNQWNITFLSNAI